MLCSVPRSLSCRLNVLPNTVSPVSVSYRSASGASVSRRAARISDNNSALSAGNRIVRLIAAGNRDFLRVEHLPFQAAQIRTCHAKERIWCRLRLQLLPV